MSITESERIQRVSTAIIQKLTKAAWPQGVPDGISEDDMWAGIARHYEAEYDRVDSMWRNARGHDSGCCCEYCMREYGRAVWNHLQNRGRDGGRWGIGDRTATERCAQWFADREAQSYRPLGDFHGISVAASSVSPEQALPTAFRTVVGFYLHPHVASERGARETGHHAIMPVDAFMAVAREHWARTHETQFSAATMLTQLAILITAWARGLAMEGQAFHAISESIATGTGRLGRAFEGHTASVEWAPNTMEGDDVDCIIHWTAADIVDPDGNITHRGGPRSTPVSIKAGRAFGLRTLRTYRVREHKVKPALYVGSRSLSSMLTPENLLVMTAMEVDARIAAGEEMG